MTQPNPGDGQGGDAGGSKPAPKAPAPKLLDVVEFTHRDVLTGGDIKGIGVVVRANKDDQTVAVRPLAHHHHEVALANVTALSAADYED